MKTLKEFINESSKNIKRFAVEFLITNAKEYYKLIGDEDTDFSYDKAVKKLNKDITKYIKNDKLSIQYKNKDVTISLPIKEKDTGNMLDPDEANGDYLWEDIEIWCEVENDGSKFNPNEVRVIKSPNEWEPQRILHSF